jgi:hypothetical protein
MMGGEGGWRSMGGKERQSNATVSMFVCVYVCTRGFDGCLHACAGLCLYDRCGQECESSEHSNLNRIMCKYTS